MSSWSLLRQLHVARETPAAWPCSEVYYGHFLLGFLTIGVDNSVVVIVEHHPTRLSASEPLFLCLARMMPITCSAPPYLALEEGRPMVAADPFPSGQLVAVAFPSGQVAADPFPSVHRLPLSVGLVFNCPLTIS